MVLPALKRDLLALHHELVDQQPGLASCLAALGHRAIAFGAKFADGLGELGHVESAVEQAREVGQERLDGRGILGVLEIVRRLPHEAQMRDAAALCCVENNQGEG